MSSLLMSVVRMWLGVHGDGCSGTAGGAVFVAGGIEVAVGIVLGDGGGGIVAGVVDGDGGSGVVVC